MGRELRMGYLGEENTYFQLIILFNAYIFYFRLSTIREVTIGYKTRYIGIKTRARAARL